MLAQTTHTRTDFMKIEKTEIWITYEMSFEGGGRAVRGLFEKKL